MNPAEVRALTQLAAAGLEAMLDSGTHLFCHRLRLTATGIVREGVSPRYTAMALLGLHRFEAAGGASPVPVRKVLDALLADTTWVDNVGDLGLLLWLCAEAAPDTWERVFVSLDARHVLERCRLARRGHTMELAWFLTGLASSLDHRAEVPELPDLAMAAFARLKANQGASGIFGHLAPRGTIPGLLRGRIGSFADQVYPILALTRFAQAVRAPEALDMARACAEAICRVQGPLGQWWWHYSASTGRVVQRYPVYSVHQDGMAPMALFELARASGRNYDEEVYRGLAWICGRNELSRDLRERELSLIWRSIFPRDRRRMYWHGLLCFARHGEDRGLPRDLEVLLESRPYHLGWLLYGFAGRGNASVENGATGRAARLALRGGSSCQKALKHRWRIRA